MAAELDGPRLAPRSGAAGAGIIPAQALFQAAQGLAALDIPVEWHLAAGIGHGIDGEGLRHGGEFLARRFKGKR